MGQTSKGTGRGEVVDTNAGDHGGSLGWRRWFVKQSEEKTGEGLTAPIFQFVKLEPLRRWFLDGVYRALDR